MPCSETCIDRHGSSPLVYHYTIVRADLPLGLQLAQTVHAAGESATPLPRPGTHAVALHARDEAHLREVAARLDARGIRHHRVLEDDGQLMAIGIPPTTDRDPIRKALSSLPCAKIVTGGGA